MWNNIFHGGTVRLKLVVEIPWKCPYQIKFFFSFHHPPLQLPLHRRLLLPPPPLAPRLEFHAAREAPAHLPYQWHRSNIVIVVSWPWEPPSCCSTFSAPSSRASVLVALSHWPFFVTPSTPHIYVLIIKEIIKEIIKKIK